MAERKAHDHICGECGAIYPCPKPLETAEQRIGLCTQCEPPEGVELFTVQQPLLTAAFVLDL